MEEFIEYYNNVGASIDNDQYFELMMINSWNCMVRLKENLLGTSV